MPVKMNMQRQTIDGIGVHLPNPPQTPKSQRSDLDFLNSWMSMFFSLFFVRF
jgi:hypothetical protein